MFVFAMVKVTVVPPGGAGYPAGRLSARLCVWPGPTAGIMPKLTCAAVPVVIVVPVWYPFAAADSVELPAATPEYVNAPVVCPEATFTVAGAIVTFAGALLDRFTVTPFAPAGAPRVKLPFSVELIPTSSLGIVSVIAGGIMLNAELTTPVSVPLLAASVYPVPRLLNTRLENVAIPFTAFTVVVPPSCDSPGLAWIAIVTAFVAPATTAPVESSSDTCTAGAIAVFNAVVTGCTWKPRCVAGLIVTTYAADATALFDDPETAAIAFTVCDASMLKGAVYSVDPLVGVLPSCE